MTRALLRCALTSGWFALVASGCGGGTGNADSGSPSSSHDAGTQSGGDGGTTETCTSGAKRECYTGEAPTKDVGRCKSGQQTCVGGLWTSCVGQVVPRAELCNGLDDNCDGVVDDGDPGAGTSCSTGLKGVCSEGVTACRDGMVLCLAQTAATDEACDGLDNDCDGQIDEGNPGGGLACTSGLPGVCAQGTSVCTAGALSCSPTALSSQEICDGLDNDCDGTVDEGNPGGGAACDTGLLGACAKGIKTCVNGALECVQAVQASAEVCDGIDNDCDGDVDEGNPGGGASCSTGLPGICEAGTMACRNGFIECEQHQQPAPAEICFNNLDDNCDGTVDENPDLDGDGYGVCDGDCCDDVSLCSSTPELVNPGAMEVQNNGVDDDCDPLTLDSAPPATACSTTPLQTPTTAMKLAQAMELCQTTTQSPPTYQKKWGVISAELLRADGVATAPNDVQVGVLSNYGPNVTPRANATMAVISSGTARDMNDPGWIQPNGGWTAGTTGNPPPGYLAAHGGKLQTTPGCPAGSGANDSVNLRLKIRVPTNAKSFSFNSKFYSSEYPEWVCNAYNDFFLTLLTSTAPGIPSDKNIVFDSMNNPVSVNVGFFNVCQGCPAGTNELVGTGMGGNGTTLNDGGGTTWLTTTAPVTPGEIITLEFIIFDVSDHRYDSLAIIDNFKWSVTPAAVGTQQ